MKVFCLKSNPELYSGNSFLLLGAWNTIDDINAVIDSGSDGYIIKEIDKIYTGVGKNPVDKVVITHNHFDHMGGAKDLKKTYNAKIYAKLYSGNLVDFILNDGDEIKLAEHEFLILHTPGHSTDSICLYNEAEQVLFSGDTTLLVRDTSGTYTPEYIDSLDKLSRLKIKIIYPGHGNPITENPEGMIKSTMKNVLESVIVA
jgi:glyoxylase-like metal-dependent hydrolase (beta-lactamase superfamily II)